MKKYLPEIVLGVGIGVWVLVLCAVAAMQYHFFLYDALDLSIYAQVFWNTVHGHFFAYTFNNYSYLADHREWIVLLISPLFAFVQHPLTLVIIQIIALGCTAMPLRGIIVELYGRSVRTRAAATGIALLALLHPSMQNMALYEFHALIFVVPLSAAVWYAYLRKQWLWFGVWSVLLLLVREDIGFMVACIGIVLLFSAHTKKAKMYSALYAGCAFLWSIAMISVGGRFFPSGSEKFLVFYPQLGTTVRGAVETILIHPLQAFSPLFAYDHLWILIVCLTSVGLLCVFSPLHILPALPQLLLMMLIPKNMLNSVFDTHYAAPIMVWLFIASVYGWKKISPRLSKKYIRIVSTFALTLVLIHGVLLSGVAFSIARAHALSTVVDVSNTWKSLDQIGSHDRVLASQTFATPLSTREYVYPMLQVFTGKDHYAESKYQLPSQVDWVVFAPRDLVEMTINFPFADVSGGWSRIEQLISKNQLVEVERTPDLVMYGHGVRQPTAEITRTAEYDAALSLHTLTQCGVDETRSFLQCSFSNDAGTEEGDMHGVVQWFDEQGHSIASEWIPFVDERLRPSHLWDIGETSIVSSPLRTPQGARTVVLALVLVHKEDAKVFLSHHSIDLSTLPYVTLDLSPLLLQ